jgi:tetratricopeptide (TPR) repeat protein
MRNSALPSTSTSLLASELFPNFLRNLPALLLYLGKALLPFHLSVYPTSEDPNLRYGYFAIAILLLVLISVPRERLLFFIFIVLWFFLFLLPSLSSAYAYLPESRLYLPLCGILFLLSEVSPELFFQRISSIIPNARRKMTIENQALFSSKRKQIAFLSIGTSLCILFVFLNFRQSHKYKNDLLFWQHAVDESPSFPLIHMRLGEAFRRNHQNEAAAKEFDIAFDKNPDLPFLRLSMASLYIEQGKLAGAEELLENDPYTKFNYSLYNDIALAYKKEGRMEEAIIRWKKSIDLNPSFMDAYASLSAAYFDQRKYEDAIWICKEIIRKEPSYRNAYNMLIEIYTFQNNPEMADYYRKQHP